MIYTANITTPVNTPQTSLKTTRITATKGLVYKVEFYFPAGSAGLMGVAVFDGLYQVWPSSVGEFFVGEDTEIDFDDLYLMESAPFEFQVYTYNTDDTHPHMVAVRIGLVSAEVFLARFLPTKSHEYLLRLVAEMSTERDLQAAQQFQQLEQTVFEFLYTETKKEQRKQQKAERRELRKKDIPKVFETVTSTAIPPTKPSEPLPTPPVPPEPPEKLPEPEPGPPPKPLPTPPPPEPEPIPPEPSEPPGKLPEPEPPAVDLPTGQKPREPGVKYPYFDVDEDDDDNNNDDDGTGGLRGPPRRPGH